MPNHRTGIPHPDLPGNWLVSPWPRDASFTDVVRHFLRSEPWDRTNSAHLSAYYLGYRAALAAVPGDEPLDAWSLSMRDCVDRCAAFYDSCRGPAVSTRCSG